MKIAIVGSRDFRDLPQVARYVHQLPREAIVISGGAEGVDRMAAAAARVRTLQVIVFHADWTQYGKSAGLRRNTEIVTACDEVVAFWDGKSSGTLDTIRKAVTAGKKVTIYGARS